MALECEKKNHHTYQIMITSFYVVLDKETVMNLIKIKNKNIETHFTKRINS